MPGRGLINEKGVTWRCAAHQPRFAPFHLRFHPLLRPSFEFSFCSLSFSPFASSYLCYTYFVNETPLLFRFFSSLRTPFRLDRLIFLFQPSLLSRIFTLLHFYTITFRNVAPPYTFPPSDSAVANDSLEFRLDQSFIHVCRFIRQTGRKAVGYYQDRYCKILVPASSLRRHPAVRILRTVSPVDYPRLPFNPQPIPCYQPNL